MFEGKHPFITILLDNYKMMSMFIRSLIEYFFTKDFSDYILEDIYIEVYESDYLSPELNKFKQLLVKSREEDIPKYCPRIDKYLKNFHSKVRPKFYIFAKSSVLNFM